MTSRERGWVAWADGLLDFTVVAFAAWTVLYEIAMFAGIPTEPLTLVWFAAAAGSAWLVVRWVRRPEPLPALPDGEPAEPSPAATRDRIAKLSWVAAGALLVVAAVLGLVDPMRLFWPMWGAAVAANAVLLWQVARRRTPSTPGAVPPPAHVVALLTSVGLAVLASFIVRFDADDVYYVNRSTWVAEHDTLTMRDTMFGPAVLDSTYGGGAPIASVEALFGVVADLTGLHAATVTYLVAVPVGSLLTGWALWRLVRTWAPRRHLLVLLGAVAFMLMSSASVIGDFSLPRMWQGKVPATTVIVPLAWVYFTQVAERGSRRALLLLAAAGAGFVGLTSTAVLLAPAMAAAALLGGILQRRLRPVLVGAVAFGAFPVVMGAVVVLMPANVGGREPRAHPPSEVLERILGKDPAMVALALVALVLAPVLARYGPSRAFAGASALAALGALAPGLLEFLNSVTGSGPVLWRMMLVAPISVLVGLLLAVRIGGQTRDSAARKGTREAATAAALASALALVLVTAGTPVWESPRTGQSRLVESPSWKLKRDALADVRRALELEHGEGPVLMPTQHMQVLAIATTESFAVSPRRLYTESFEKGEAHVEERLFLSRFASGDEPDADPSRVDTALSRLDVSMVCLRDDRLRAITVTKEAGYRRAEDIGRLVCLRPPASS